MNASEQPDPNPQKSGCLIRSVLIVLPIGLAFMVPLSLWIYYQKKYQPAPATSQYAAMLRKDLDAADFDRYVRIFTQDIGERSLEKRDNLETAAAFVESTMGYDNMGYAMQRQTFEVLGRPVVNLIAELTGKREAEEIVLVVANYDDADAAGISALMCVAHALAGSERARTIRFAAVMSQGGLAKAMENAAADGKKLRKVIAVGSQGRPKVSATSPDEAVQQFEISQHDSPSNSLKRLRELQSFIEHTAD